MASVSLSDEAPVFLQRRQSVPFQVRQIAFEAGRRTPTPILYASGLGPSHGSPQM